MGNSSATNNSTRFNKEDFTNQLGSSVQGYFNKGPDPVFGKSLYAGMSDATRQGLSGLVNNPNNEGYSGAVSGALTDFGDIAAGNRFGMNDPGYSTLRQNVANDAVVAANSPFLSSGTFGSDKHKEAVGRGTAGALAGLDYGNFQNDQTRQMQAMQMLPGIYQASQMPAQAQLAAGQSYDADAQSRLLGEQDLFNRTNQAEYDKLARTLGLLGSGPIQNQQQRQDPTLLDALGWGATAVGAFF